MMKNNVLLILSCFTINSIEAFLQLPLRTTTTTTTTASTKLHGFIAADSVDEEIDMTLGGVGLAQESAILLLGKVDKRGSAIVTDMKRYTDVTAFDEQDSMDQKGVSVLCKGEGIELYQDPGTRTDKLIILAPLDAISNALDDVNDAVAKKDAKKILINFTGGDDLMVHEVLESVKSLVSSLDLQSSNQSIQFRSMCHKSFPIEKCSVVVLSVANGSELTDDLYWHEGKWWTLLEENLNTANA